MSTFNRTFYEGFEGEPEIIFMIVKSNDVKEEISIWDGYFDAIIETIKPKKEGWTALAYYYHLYIGWYNESPWLIENLIEVYDQLSEIINEEFRFEESKEVLRIILKMLSEALVNNYKVFISYN